METAEMRRSTLQRKDRDELTQIATTLGKKPSSRARKGEIIDLILDLAAGGDGGGNAEETDESDTDVTDATASTDTGEAADDDNDICIVFYWIETLKRNVSIRTMVNFCKFILNIFQDNNAIRVNSFIFRKIPA